MSYNYSFKHGRRNRIVGPSSIVSAAGIFTPHASQKYTLGLELDLNDATGRWFRYCQNSGTAILAKALVNSSAALDAEAITSTNQAAAPYLHSEGDKEFDVLLSTGNGWSDDDLIDGWMLISDGTTAIGDMYMIKSNKWTTSDTVMHIVIADEGGIRNDMVAADDVICFQSKYANTVVSATNPVSGMVGVSLADVPKSYYYWAQFRGYAPILVDGTDTVVVGDTVTLSSAVDGTIHLNDALADDVIVGTCVHSGAVGEPCIVDMLIP